MKKSFTNAMLLAAGMFLLLTGSASAESVSQKSRYDLDFTFAAPSNELSFTYITTPNLTAGEYSDGFRLASFSLRTLEANSSITTIGIAFDPYISTQQYLGNQHAVLYQLGTANPGNLIVGMSFPGFSLSSVLPDDHSGEFATATLPNGQPLNGVLEIVGDQVVLAGTYRATLLAAILNP